MPFDDSLDEVDPKTSVRDIRLRTRVINCLVGSQIMTVGALAAHTEEQLMSIERFGIQCLSDVKAALADCGYSLSVPPPFDSAGVRIKRKKYRKVPHRLLPLAEEEPQEVRRKVRDLLESLRKYEEGW